MTKREFDSIRDGRDKAKLVEFFYGCGTETEKFEQTKRVSFDCSLPNILALNQFFVCQGLHPPL